jgi:hypothetical protein
MHTIFWLENLKGRDHSEDLGIDGSVILEWILGKCGGKENWVHMDQVRDQWWAVVNTVMKLQVP